jgi:hypothetical protein
MMTDVGIDINMNTVAWYGAREHCGRLASFHGAISVDSEDPIKHGRQPGSDAQEDDDGPRDDHRGEFFAVRRLKPGDSLAAVLQIEVGLVDVFVLATAVVGVVLIALTMCAEKRSVEVDDRGRIAVRIHWRRDENPIVAIVIMDGGVLKDWQSYG